MLVVANVVCDCRGVCSGWSRPEAVKVVVAVGRHDHCPWFSPSWIRSVGKETVHFNAGIRKLAVVLVREEGTWDGV